MQTSPAIPLEVAPASATIARRVAAFFVDNVVFGTPLAIVNGVVFGSSAVTGQILGALISTAYFAILWSRIGGGQTVGMRLLGLRVVGEDGAELSLRRALLRSFALSVSMAAAFVGVIMALFDARGRGLHDRLAKTLVVRA